MNDFVMQQSRKMKNVIYYLYLWLNDGIITLICKSNHKI